MQEDISPSTDSALSPSPLPWYYRRVFPHYHGITVMFVPVTFTTAVKYIVLSPFPQYYHGITVVPITVQLSTMSVLQCLVLPCRSSLRSPDQGDLIVPRVLLAEVFPFSAPVTCTLFHHTFDHHPSVVQTVFCWTENSPVQADLHAWTAV